MQLPRGFSETACFRYADEYLHGLPAIQNIPRIQIWD